jgi:hypothetical protein
MGNVTRPKTNSPSRRLNVQSVLNRIKNHQERLKNESSKLQTLYKNMGKRLESGMVYESDFIRFEAIKRRVMELLAEKKALEKAYRNMIQFQIKHWA